MTCYIIFRREEKRREEKRRGIALLI